MSLGISLLSNRLNKHAFVVIVFNLFVRKWRDDPMIYEGDPNNYCEIVHEWFSAEVAEQKKMDERRNLQTLMSLEYYRNNKAI